MACAVPGIIVWQFVRNEPMRVDVRQSTSLSGDIVLVIAHPSRWAGRGNWIIMPVMLVFAFNRLISSKIAGVDASSGKLKMLHW